MERTGIGPLAEVLQRNFEAITSSTTIAARVLADVTTSEAIRGFADTASRLADLGGVANLGGPTQSAAWAGFADLAAASSVQRMATLGLLDGMRPYESLLSEMASSRSLVEAFRGVEFTALGDTIAANLASFQRSWVDLSFASLAVAVDTSLVGAVGAVLDAYQGLLEPFGREAAAWMAWLPLHPGALEPTPEADHVWTSAAAHVLTRTAVAASVSNESDHTDRDRVDEAIEAGRRLRFDLDLPLPGTPFRLRDVLYEYAPGALEAFEGAMTALAARNPDAARHVGVSLREGVKEISKVVAPSLPPGSPPAERWRSAVGVAIADPLQARMLIAQIDVLDSISDETSGAVHGSSNDLGRLEVALKAATAALCSVLASWVITQGIVL
jgi:hypothetical protein